MHIPNTNVNDTWGHDSKQTFGQVSFNLREEEMTFEGTQLTRYTERQVDCVPRTVDSI